MKSLNTVLIFRPSVSIPGPHYEEYFLPASQHKKSFRWDVADCPTQLIFTWISICSVTKLKELSTRKASGDYWFCFAHKRIQFLEIVRKAVDPHLLPPLPSFWIFWLQFFYSNFVALKIDKRLGLWKLRQIYTLKLRQFKPFFVFLAVQESVIGDIVTDELSEWVSTFWFQRQDQLTESCLYKVLFLRVILLLLSLTYFFSCPCHVNKGSTSMRVTLSQLSEACL